MKVFSFIGLLFIASLLGGCAVEESTPPEAALILDKTRAKIADNATHRYRYVSFWDNRFANSTYEDSMRVTYTRQSNTELGFAFFVEGDSYDELYNGKDNLRINHQKREVVRTPMSDITQDSAYFDHKMYFLAHPRELPSLEAFDRVTSITENGQLLWTYQISSQAPSTVTPEDTIFNTRTYFIEPAEAVLVRVKNVSRNQLDTIQVIEYNFMDYDFDSAPYTFTDRDRESSLGYREITPAAANAQRLAGLIKPGDQLHRADYPDINGQEQLIYGTPGKKSVIMFSFVGCGGCEYALREMKKHNYETRPGLDFYYSSPVDEPSALLKYFKKKEFPHIGFGKNSQMNEVFHAAAFPTFVFIDEAGEVERVMGGYDDEVAELVNKK